MSVALPPATELHQKKETTTLLKLQQLQLGRRIRGVPAKVLPEVALLAQIRYGKALAW